MFFTLEDYRKIEEYLKLNSKKDTDFVILPEEEILAEDDIITVVHKGINHKIPFSTMANVIEKCRTDVLKKSIEDLLNQIDSLLISGLALSNHFGDDPHIGISLKTLTEALDAVWRKLEDITGEVLRGFTWEVTPTYFISETPQTISVTASPITAGLVFEHIALYVDDELITEEENISTFSHTFEITDTSIVRCEAKILGMPYTRQQTVTHYNSFFMGGGSNFRSIMNLAHIIPISNNMRGEYDIQIAESLHLFIVLGESLRHGFMRADINGIEIAFSETTETVDGKTYKVLTSEETFSAGKYNIDING